MTPFTTLTSAAVPILLDNIDTDTIIPSREMKTTGRTGLADGLFAPWRYTDAATRQPAPDFALNQSQAKAASVLLGGANFGCGSSREHAVWALLEFGIRCIIAPDFAPIFAANCKRNGLLPIALPAQDIAPMAWQDIVVDLGAQSVTCASKTHEFAIDEEAKAMMLEGLDAIDLSLCHLPEIDTWTKADRVDRPWVYLEKSQ